MQDWDKWLIQYRQERMDASSELFNDKRREFHLARYKFALDYVPDKIVGDMACGTGYGTKLLAQRAQKVHGVDCNIQAIQYAMEKHNAPNIQYTHAFVNWMPLNNEAMDVIVSFETIEHVENDVLVIKEFHRLLKPEGVLIISTPNNWGTSKYHKKAYTLESFRELLSGWFTIGVEFNQNSGSAFTMNRKQSAGIIPTTQDNQHLAECFIMVCVKE